MHLQFHAVTSLQPLGILLLFFVAHLLAGALAPYVRGYRPPLLAFAEMAAIWLERRLNRNSRGDAQLATRGALVVYVLMVAAAGIGWAVSSIMYRQYGWVAGLVVLSIAVSVMAPLKSLRVVLKALEKGDAKLAAFALSPYIDEDLSRADNHALARKAVEFGALSLNRYCVAPVAFFAVFGPIGLFCILAVLGMHGVFGTDEPARRHFGDAVRRIEAVLNFIPARVTVFLVALSALVVPRANPARALRTAWNQARFYTPKNDGFIVAGVAGCLGVTLGGRIMRRSNYVIENKWVGPEGSSAQLSTADLQRGALLVFVSYLWLIVMTSGVFLAVNLFT